MTSKVVATSSSSASCACTACSCCAASASSTSSVSSTTATEQKKYTFFPDIKPYKTGRLKVSKVHELYYEECGNPKGQPVVFLHGGPGGGLCDYYRCYFDPKAYRIVLFDQRGSGQSTPNACLEDNTTWDLVEDIEKIREAVGGIEKWVVFGGSWGSTLALAYAETYPKRVKALILRGIFLIRESELLWFYQAGAHNIFPDAWDKFVAPIPLVERGHLMSAYHRRLTGTDEKAKVACGKAWSVWEMTTSRLYVDPKYIQRASEDDKFAVQFARIENHYFVNGAWLKTDSQLLDDAYKLKDIPGVIVQGRYDLVCPMKSAWDLCKVWKNADLKVISDAGHSCKEPGIVHELIAATEKFKNLQ
eukprot:TRINITY_DN7406_c0_g1_i1.p1 TRINITY_DN7406_c0_g1~~TRINITY_DN7406_c0_g1_i1.p1  ORF type:complete len:369 (-),score=87.13 TRINITY_DN7406_c0_g1_i1:311-1393(-)